MNGTPTEPKISTHYQNDPIRIQIDSEFMCVISNLSMWYLECIEIKKGITYHGQRNCAVKFKALRIDCIDLQSWIINGTGVKKKEETILFTKVLTPHTKERSAKINKDSCEYVWVMNNNTWY